MAKKKRYGCWCFITRRVASRKEAEVTKARESQVASNLHPTLPIRRLNSRQRASVRNSPLMDSGINRHALGECGTVVNSMVQTSCELYADCASILSNGTCLGFRHEGGEGFILLP
jgi:hypothetical protein